MQHISKLFSELKKSGHCFLKNQDQYLSPSPSQSPSLMAPPNNNNLLYFFYLLSLFCSLSITVTSSWIAHIPLSWWPFLIPLLFVLVIISASGSGFLLPNNGTQHVLRANALIPNQNALRVAPMSPEQYHTPEHRMNGKCIRHCIFLFP